MSCRVNLSASETDESFSKDQTQELIRTPKKLTMTIDDAASEFNCSPNHIRKFINSGELPSFKLGQLRLINGERLDELRFRLEKMHTIEMIGDAS